MILDALAEAPRYVGLSPRLAAAFAFLDRFQGELALGRHDIQGDDIYALVQRYTTKPVAERQFEAHRRYLDVQYVHTGRELMVWAPLPLLTQVTMPYDQKGDAALYGLIPERVAVPVRPGQFVIFFPADGHIPACAWDEPGEVSKVVVKVRL